jgi:diguanylate cyclase (GGDEF)-like protein
MSVDEPQVPRETSREETLRSIIALQNRIVAAGLQLEAVMATVVQEVPALLRAATGAVVELREGDRMVYRAGSGAALSAIGLALTIEGSLSGACILERRPLYSKDCTSDPRVDATACRQLGIKSMICAPLFHGEEAIGACKAFAPDIDAFTHDDIDILDALASVIGASVSHAMQFEAAVNAGRVDTLTGLGNRAAFEEDLARAIARARRTTRALSLGVLDLNGFKRLNDRHGHRAGDAALASVAAVLRTSLRASDAAYRLGGDEFAVVLPEATWPATALLVERLRENVERIRVHEESVGLSAGIVELRDDDSVETFYERADQAMYGDKTTARSLQGNLG